MIIENFLRDILDASNLEVDSRWEQWARWVDSVDKNRPPNYAFRGEFVKSGTQEISLNRPRLILVMSESGSQKNRSCKYQVIQMNPDGKLIDLGDEFYTDGEELGWAVRLRDKVADKVAELESGTMNNEDYIAMLEEDVARLAEYLSANWPRYIDPATTHPELRIVDAAIQVMEACRPE